MTASLAATGCSSLAVQQLDVLGLFGPQRPQPPAEGAPSYTVVVKPSAGKADAFRMPITEPITVQEALEQSRTLGSFRRQLIAIERQQPRSNRRHRMPIQYDLNTQQVSPTTDYALLPGDHLVVEEDPTTIIDDTFETLTSSLGPINR